jgi:phosphotransferase system enzyme I (PtsI)
VSEKTADLYEPGHPAILRFIKRTIDAANEAGISVSVCGEISSDPAFVLIMLGMGMRDLSMSALNVLQIKKLIRSVTLADTQQLADEALKFKTGHEVESFARRRLKELVPDFQSIYDDYKKEAA